MGLNKPIEDYTVQELFSGLAVCSDSYANEDIVDLVATKHQALRYRATRLKQYITCLEVLANELEWPEGRF